MLCNFVFIYVGVCGKVSCCAILCVRVCVHVQSAIEFLDGALPFPEPSLTFHSNAIFKFFSF